MSGVGELHGADPETVRRAIGECDPLPGTATPPVRGFAGALSDGRLVRDVLGRRPLFVDGGAERDARAEKDAGGTGDASCEPGGRNWAFDPRELAAPEPFPAGAVTDGGSPEPTWGLPDPATRSDDRTATDEVRTALSGALDDAPDAPVAFSGGVDSAVVASGTVGPLYVVGFPDSHDVEAAKDAARAFDRDLGVVELSTSTLERVVPEVARATGRTNAMDVSIAVPLYLAAERAAADGYDRLAVGQGADELFGGYAKVERAPGDPRVDADTVRGARREVLGTLPAQLPRDVLAMRANGVEPVAPLLDDRVVAAALRLPERLLVDDRGERKVALRRAASEFAPARVAYREKKAVQYGSLVARELDRLARQSGFKRRMDDHVRKYVESLL